MYARIVFTVCALILLSRTSVASNQDQIRPGSLVCKTTKSYNETIIVDLKNQLAAMKGGAKVPYPPDCRFLNSEGLSVSFIEYSGGSAVTRVGETTLHTAKKNVILGTDAAAREKRRDQCLKKVVDKYCLGSDISELPKPFSNKDDSYIYEDGNETILIKELAGRIATVSIFYPNPSWLSYRLLLDQLQEKYGSGTNFDNFPDYANSDSSKETAITLGKGRAMTLWNQTGWSLKYGWASDRWRILTYMHNELSDRLRVKEIDRL